MRAVDASGNRTAPLAVDSDRIRVEASYFSIVPRIVNVVESGGVDWTAAASTTAPRPETTAADNSSTESRFLMTGPWADAMRNEPWPQHQRACPSIYLGYNPIKTWLTAGYMMSQTVG